MRIGKQDQAHTAIATSDADSITIRGHDLCGDLIGQIDFTDYFWLLVTGERPTPTQVAVTNACMVAIAEHGLVGDLHTVALVGTNFSINAAFYNAYGTKERRRTAEEYRDVTIVDTIPGIVAPGVMTALVIIVGLAFLAKRDAPIAAIGRLTEWPPRPCGSCSMAPAGSVATSRPSSLTTPITS